MRKTFRIYGAAARAAVSSAMAYRADFFFNFFINLVSNLFVPLVTVLIYTAGAELPGWSVYEALLIQSVFMLCTGLCAPFLYNVVRTTMYSIREGTYDLILIRPCSALTSTMAFSFDLDGLGVLVGGVTMFSVSLSKLPPPPLLSWVLFGFLLLMGVAVLFGCISLMTASAFKFVGNGRIFEIFDSATQFGRYPLTIFPKWLTGILSSVFPMAMLGFFPASALLQKPDSLAFWAVIPCVLFMLLGVFVFKRMVRSYQSAGG